MDTTSSNIDEMMLRLMQEKDRNETRRAYLVVPPDFLSSMKIEPIEFPESEPIRFRPYVDYSVRMMGVPIITSRFMDIGPSSAPIAKPVVWKDIPKPASVPAWKWCVVVASLSWLLCAVANSL